MIELPQTTPPPLLYHYTTMGTLLRMLENIDENGKLSLWASHIQYVNDRTESLIAEQLFRRMLQIYTEMEFDDEPRRPTEVRRYMEASFRLIFEELRQSYIVCLSEQQDSLPMWHRYGNDGQGVAIGLSSDYLQRQEPEWRMCKCDYPPEPENAKFPDEDVLAEDYNELIGSASKERQERMEKTTQSLRALVHSVWFKHPCYAYEKEWRLHSRRDTDIRFRERNGLIVPYIELRLPAEAIKEIRIGPTARQELSARSLGMFFASKKIEAELYTSSLPYVIL